MKGIITLMAILLSFFFFASLPVFAHDGEKTEKIWAELEAAKQKMGEVESFQKELHANLRIKEIDDRTLIYNLMHFDAKIIELDFQINITEAIFRKSLGQDIGDDPLLELQIELINKNGKSLIQFVEEMVPIIKDGIKTLENKRKQIEMFLVK